MAMDDIKKKLEQRFSDPLPEFYERRIIFWNDEDKEFLGEIVEFVLNNAKKLVLTETNNFEIKKILNHDDLTNNYLVYNPIKVEMENDWLLDIKLYSEEFRADQLSMWMQEMHIEQNPAIRHEIKQYRSFLNAASRRKLVSQFGEQINSPSKLHMAILASICKVQSLDPKAIIKAVMEGGNDETNSLKMELYKYNAADKFWTMVSRTTGYSNETVPNVDEMDTHIVLSALTKTMPERYLAGLENRYNSFQNGFCYEMLDEWLHSDKKEDLVLVLRAVEKKLHLFDRFNKIDVRVLANSEILPCIDEVVLNKLMEHVIDHTISADELIKTIETRRIMVWYEENKEYYNGLLQVAEMQKFHDNHIVGFHHTNGKEIWNAYIEDYCSMDTYYRKFHVAFAQSLTNYNPILDDHFRKVVDEVEGLYEHWFLDRLAENFTNVTETDLAETGEISGIDQQSNFYERVVSSYENKLYVIISDALRYEIATDIAELLKSETKADVKLESQQSIFPSITKFGMAALLPHRELSLVKKGESLKVLIDGNPTDMADRDDILKRRKPNSVAVRYKDLILMKKVEQRELIKGQDVIYIYHDTIDSMGHHDEINTFTACETARSEIVNLVRMLTGSLNGLNIVITSDHGFLYTYQPLRDSDKLEWSSFKKDIIEQGRRYVITNDQADPEFLMPVKGFYNKDGYKAFTPRENIRIKGSGSQNFVHGGASLQELVVPVIRYKYVRSDYKGYQNNKEKYDTQPVTIGILSASRKISNMIFSLDFYQKEAVKDNYVPSTYNVFMMDLNGNIISDIQKIVADRKSLSGVDRIFRLTFNLKQRPYNSHELYYLVIQDEEGLQAPVKEEMQIDISMAFDDFDFFS